jgi:hypothetical protein
MAAHVIGDERTWDSSGRNNNQMFVEAVLWIVRTGAPWRDVPLRSDLIQKEHQKFCLLAR